MGTTIGNLNVRRSIWIDASPARVWQEFTSLERMQQWFGTGHRLVAFEPRVGGAVETDAGDGDDEYRFVGEVVVFDPGRELSFTQDWVNHGWPKPPVVTLRLTPLDEGTLVELFHHGFEDLGGTAEAADNHAGFEDGWTLRQLLALRDVVGS